MFQGHRFERATVNGAPFAGTYKFAGTLDVESYLQPALASPEPMQVVLEDIITGAHGVPRDGQETRPAANSVYPCISY
jgi:hypothetical protein